jgi:AP-3 complex subunit sigma
VEALDKCFENVCELDLIFHSDKVRSSIRLSVPLTLFTHDPTQPEMKRSFCCPFPSPPLPSLSRILCMQVHYVLDEIIMAGMVLETNILHILQTVTDQNRLHSSSQKGALTPATKARTPTIGPAIGRMLPGR